MKSYLKIWLTEFPKLSYLLSTEDKILLNKIDPRQYENFNLTQESEVISIINEHKPQAWKWIRMYPSLKNLSPEDYAILDHIVPNNYIGEVSEQDVRRIIEYRKSEIHRTIEDSEAVKAKMYYEDHKEEIQEEEKLRSRIMRSVKYVSMAGVSFLTASVVLRSSLHLGIGVTLFIAPWILCSLKLKHLDQHSVIPRSQKKQDSKLGFFAIAFIVLYYIGFIGMGITLGMLLVWEPRGWDIARSVMIAGLSITGVSVVLFLILAIVTSPRE